MALRKALGMTGNDLARRIDRAHTYIWKFETGRIIPKLNSIEHLARALHIGVPELVDERLSIHDLAGRFYVRSAGEDELVDAIVEDLVKLSQSSRAALLKKARTMKIPRPRRGSVS